VVHDKLFLPGVIKLRRLVSAGFFGRVLSVRLEFGYWVFEGDQIPYQATADDAAYAVLEFAGGAFASVNSSWAVRVNRRELLEVQVDGTHGSAVTGLRSCAVQHRVSTPLPVWNPDLPDYQAQRTDVPDNATFDNGFKVEWELFLANAAEGLRGGTDQLPDGERHSIAQITGAYAEQMAFVQATGADVILMASRAPAASARGARDYLEVYGELLRQADRPVILHWLGEAFDPALRGYWGSTEFDPAAEVVLELIERAGRDLGLARRMVADGIGDLVPEAQRLGVRLGIEALHPMFCADRSVIASLGQAIDLAARFPADAVGVVVDTYHVWWDSRLADEIARASGRIVGYQVCDWTLPLPAHTLLGRAYLGDGVIDFGPVTAAVIAAGYRGYVEVEIFNAGIWAAPADQTAATVRARFAAVLCPANRTGPALRADGRGY
jgi:sugar phosphate isomerase/epimerase